MKQVTLTGKKIYGQSIRTKNVNETNPETAKISGLWEDFFSKTFPQLTPGTRTYGVYYNYESDHAGEFSVLAGTDVLVPNQQGTQEEITLADGNYVVFSGSGEMPKTVIEVWGQVWAYFTDSDCPHMRTYKTDFELYGKDGTSVEIYMAVE